MVLPYSNFIKIITTILDILIVWVLLYYAMKIVRSNSRTTQIFKGIIIIIIIKLVANYLNLNTVSWFADNFLNWGFLAIIVIFQPEIRGILERLGKSNILSSIVTLTGDERERLVKEIMKAVAEMAEKKTGALISIEQSISLADYIKTGTKLLSEVSAELLVSIFTTTTPLHDGAVIIQGDKIACASAYFPPTDLDMPSRYGARHRAAIGISQVSDAITVVVSEETGHVSIARSGELMVVTDEQLFNYLMQHICYSENVNARVAKKTKAPIVSKKLTKTNVKQENNDEVKKEAKGEETTKTDKIEVQEVNGNKPLKRSLFNFNKKNKNPKEDKEAK